ncbi:tetratricopeptide repeat protein [Stigmatella hybrida]|uniref:tetratricopeptide repeat protein n=1 Tax=Stigmatella hybrida TaxID=394097 RepID=UPI001CDB43C1|nr:tetratricopeptide repeat protein [Stigmatella hybrida]
MRVLLPIAPELEVHTEARRLAEAAPGSTVVLVPRVEDADWLNLNRPLFASRELRAVLFCTREVSVALARGAVDFIDWMSLRVECPSGPAPFAVAGLRAALAARAPGLVWTEGDLEASFAAARPRRKLRKVSAASPYVELLSAAKAHRGAWLAWTDVEGDFQSRRIRWALAEARRRTPTLLVSSSVRAPGWFAVHGLVMGPAEARARLEQAGAKWPGRLASLAELEPESIHLLSQFLEQGVSETALHEGLLEESDPGCYLGRLALERGLSTEHDAVRGKAPPPVVRALEKFPGQSRALRASELSRIGQQLKQGGKVTAEDAAWWSAWLGARTSQVDLEGVAPRAEIAEALLQQRQRTGLLWETLTTLAIATGDLETARSWAQRTAAADPSRWSSLVKTLHAEGRYPEAEALLRHHLATNEQMPGMDRAWIHHHLSDVLREQGKNAEAETLLRQLLSADKHLKGAWDGDSAASLHLLALVLSHQGKQTEAEELLRQSLAITKREHGEQNPDYISLLRDFSSVLEEQGRYREAEKFLRKCMALQERALGPLAPAYAQSLYSLSWLLQMQGQYDGAEKSLLRALTIQEQALGQQHPSYGASLHDLAVLRIRQNQLAEAEQLLLRSQSITEQTVGSRHAGYAASLHELARVRMRQGRFAEAEDLMRQATTLTAETLGPTSSDYAASLHQLALLIDAQGRYPEAEEVLRQSITILEQELGPEHPEVIAPLYILAVNLFKQGRTQESEPILVRALSSAQKRLGNQHPITAQILNQLARVEYALNKKGAAKRAKQAMDALRSAFGSKHPTTQQALPELRHIAASRAGKQR